MLKKCNRILAFLLALVLVITTFKSDFNELRVFADEGDENSGKTATEWSQMVDYINNGAVEEPKAETDPEVKLEEEKTEPIVIPEDEDDSKKKEVPVEGNAQNQDEDDANEVGDFKLLADAGIDVQLVNDNNVKAAEVPNGVETYDHEVTVIYVAIDADGNRREALDCFTFNGPSDATYDYNLSSFDELKFVDVETFNDNGLIFKGWKDETGKTIDSMTLYPGDMKYVYADFEKDNVDDNKDDDQPETPKTNILVYHKNINAVESEEDIQEVSLGEFGEDVTKKPFTTLSYEKVFGEIEDKTKEFLGWRVAAVGDIEEFELTGENNTLHVEKDGKYDLYAIWGDAEQTVTVTFKGSFYSNGWYKGTFDIGEVTFPANEALSYEDAAAKASELILKYNTSGQYDQGYKFYALYLDSLLTKRFNGFDSLTSDTILYARGSRGADNKVYYFLLGKQLGLKAPSEGPQAVEDYYPDKNNETNDKYIWTGKANPIDSIDSTYFNYTGTDGYKAIYHWDGSIVNSDVVSHSYDNGIESSINSYLQDAAQGNYGSEFEASDIIWYVYKKHKDGNHIDGYVSSYVTYYANEDKLIGGIKESQTVVQDSRERYGYEVDVRDNTMFTPTNAGYEFLGWSQNKDATVPDAGYDAESLKKATKPTVILDKKVKFYAVWKSTEAKYKLVIQVDAEGADKDTYLKYDGNVHYANVNVKVNAELIKKESAKAENNTGIAVASIANKLRSSFSNAVSSALNFGTITAYAAEPKKTDPVDEVKTTIEDGTEVIVKGLKTIADPGIDVGNYDVNLDYSGLEIIRTSDGQDIKDLFEVEVVRTSTGGETITETSKPTDPKEPKLIAQLHILKRNVVLSSGSASKQYDGTPLTRDGVSIGGDGFANGTRGQEGATYNVTGSQTAVGSSGNPFTYTLKPENTFAGNYNITVNYGTLTVTPVPGDNPPPPEENPPTITPPAEGQVLGAVRPVDGAAVLGARRGRTEDSANTLGRIITIIVAAGIGFTMIFIKRKKNEE